MISLKKGAMHLVIAPEYGGCLHEARLDQTALLRPTPSGHTDPLFSACYPCVPYFGRITEPFVKNGQPVRLAPTNPKHFPHTPLHGEGWVMPWHVTTQTDNFIQLDIKSEAPGDGQYPYAWSARQLIEITHHGFSIILTLTNLDNENALMGAGLHPFFPCNEFTKLSLEYARTVSPPAIATTNIMPDIFKQPDTLPAHTLDHSFDGLCSDIILNGANQTRLRLSTNAPIAHIYHPANNDFVCIEPVTHLPGALSADHPHAPRPIAPGASLTLSMHIDAITQQ